MENRNSDQFLKDVLEDEDYRSFTEALRETAAAEFRRVHRWNSMLIFGRLAAVLAMLAGIVRFYWPAHDLQIGSSTPLPSASSVPAAGPSFLVESVPLEASQQVSAIVFPPVVETRLLNPNIWITRRESSALLVRTAPSKAVATVSDSELFEFLPERPVILATFGPGQKQLLILEHASAPGFETQ